VLLGNNQQDDRATMKSILMKSLQISNQTTEKEEKNKIIFTAH
jgi:hypothetical protein